MKQTPKLRQLRALREVSKWESVSKAAEHLNLSQPAVTRSIKSLESDFGVEFFSRSSKRMILTKYGAVLLNRIDRAIAQLENTEMELSRSKRSTGKSTRLYHLSKFATNHELDAVISIAETQNVSHAANNMGISQPAVNRSLRSLEQRLELNLFERTSRGMMPTLAGELVIQRSKIVYSEIRKALEELDNLKGVGRGEIHIGVLPTARVQLVPIAVERFLKKHPEVHISIAEGMYESQLRSLSHGDVDIIVGTIREQSSEDEITAHKLFDESSVLAVRTGHPLLQQKNINLPDLENASWVVPHPNVPMRVQFEHLLAENKLSFSEKYIETDSLIVIRSLLIESDRIALVSKNQVYLDEKLGFLKIVPIKLKIPLRPIGFVTLSDFLPTPNLTEFLSCLRQVAGEITH